jgi:hypothetical protein
MGIDVRIQTVSEDYQTSFLFIDQQHFQINGIYVTCKLLPAINERILPFRIQHCTLLRGRPLNSITKLLVL